MKRRLFLVATALVACLMVSCAKDDFKLGKPIRVQGEIDPGLSLPLVARGQWNLNDMLTSLGGQLDGALLDDTLITFHYETEMSQTIDLSNSFGSKSTPKFKNYKPYKTGHPATKSGAIISVDTTISYEIALDFFNNLEDINLQIAHFWLDMGLFVNGYCPESTRELLRANTTISLDSLQINYIKKGETTITPFSGNAELATEKLVISDFIAGDSMKFTRVNMASLINDRPEKLIASLKMHLNIDSTFAESILADPTQITQFTQMLDSIKLDSLTYRAKLNVDLPFEISGNMTYEHEIPISQTATNGEQKQSLSQMIEEIETKLKETGITLEMDTLNRLIFEFDNYIPLNLTLNAAFVDANGNVTDSLFSNGVVASAETIASAGNPGVRESSAPKTSRVNVGLTLNKLKRLGDAANIKFNIELSTDGTDKMKIQRTNYLNIRVKVQLHPDLTFDIPVFNK